MPHYVPITVTPFLSHTNSYARVYIVRIVKGYLLDAV